MTAGFGVEQVPWDREARHRMPVGVWRDIVDQYFPNSGWLRLDRDTIESLARYRSARGLTGLGPDRRRTARGRHGAGDMSSIEAARRVADAVRDEGYLLYPYRSTSSKNQIRWQFGVLGPPGAAAAGTGEEATMVSECLLRTLAESAAVAEVTVHLRFLQLQLRAVEAARARGLRTGRGAPGRW